MSGLQKIDSSALKNFRDKGYIVVRNLLSAAEAHRYRLLINQVFGQPNRELTNSDINGRTYTLADGVTKTPAFWPIIFNKNLLAISRELLGDNIRYSQHSDLHINLGAGKFHRDSAYRDFGIGPDWDESMAPYRVARIAIYLSDWDESRSSLVVLPGTHKRESLINRLEMRVGNELRTRWRKQFNSNLLPHWVFTMKREVLRHRPGDCIIIDQRILHAGGMVRGPKPKYAIYLSYGLDNHHTRNHRKHYLSRATYLENIPTKLATRLDEASLHLTSVAT